MCMPAYPNWKIFYSDIIQLLGDARGPHHVHQLVLVEPDLLQVSCSQVSCAHYFIL